MLSEIFHCKLSSFSLSLSLSLSLSHSLSIHFMRIESNFVTCQIVHTIHRRSVSNPLNRKKKSQSIRVIRIKACVHTKENGNGRQGERERERNKGNCVCVSMNACIIRTSVDASDHQFVIQCREWERMKERERERKKEREKERQVHLHPLFLSLQWVVRVRELTGRVKNSTPKFPLPLFFHYFFPLTLTLQPSFPYTITLPG